MAAKYSVIPEQKGIITEQLLKNLSSFDIPDNNVYKDLLTAKIVAVVVLGLGSFLLGLLPVQLAKWFNWKSSNSNASGNNLVISLLLCFGGGVLMYTTFIHLQPEVREEMEELIKEGRAPHFDQLADLVFCMGFFFVYLIEEVVHGILDSNHNHSEDEAFLHRTVSLRRCAKGKGEQGVDQSLNQTIIPRVSLNQTTDGKALEMSPKSTSTQVLLDSSSLSTIHDPGNGNSFEQNYPSKLSPLDPEAQMTGGKFCIYSQYQKSNEKTEDDSSGKDFYEKSFQPMGKTTPRTHSHSLFDDDTNSSSSENSVKLSNTFRGFFTVLALSFHAVFEGLAVGLENEVTKVWYLFLAIATHKFVISFCVGVDLLSTRTKTLLMMLYLGTFSFVTPLGIGIGIALSNDPTTTQTDLSTLILQGMAAGTLLYVVFFEVLQREKANSQSGILQLIAILAGFGVMLALQFVTGHHHHHHDTKHLDLSHLVTSSSSSSHHHSDEVGHHH